MSMVSTVLEVVDVAPDSALGKAVEGRANVLEMTDMAEQAVLRPKDAGPWPHTLRAALAARIAQLNGEVELAKRYSKDAGTFLALADPNETGEAEGLAEVLAFVDKVTADTRHVVAADISRLQAAGVADADIVRLSELNAFLAYQLRVIAGLRLMKGRSA